MCKSKKHSTTEHKRRATLGRLNSSKWKASSKGHSKRMKLWWKSNYKAMCQTRRNQVTKECSARIGKKIKKLWADPEWRAKMCKIRKIQSKGNQTRHPKASWYRTMYAGSQGKFWMRSGWEVAFAKWLDANNVAWEYESQKFNIGKGRYYVPDFYLPSRNEHVEIKGWMTKKDCDKINAFRQRHPDEKFLLLFGEHLKAANIIPLRRAA